MKLTYIISFLLLISISSVSAFDFPHTVVTINYDTNVSNLSQMSDVNIPTPTDNYVLSWDSATSMWIDVAPSAVGDTNETTRFNTLVGTNCGAGEYAYGVDATGLVECRADQTGAGNSSFNQSLTDSLYYLITNPFGFYNSTDFSISDYFTSAQILAFNYFNLTNFPYTHLTNFTDDLGDRGYTSLSNFSNDLGVINGTDGINGTNGVDGINGTNLFTEVNQTQFDNSTGVLNFRESWLTDFVNALISVFDFSDYALISDLVNQVGNWSADKGDYYTSSEVDLGFYPLNNPYSYINDSSGFVDQDYGNATYYKLTNPFGFYNSTNFDIADYVTIATLVDLVGNWTADKSDYSTTAEADLLYYDLGNSYGYYNSTNPQPDSNYTEDEIEAFIFDNDNTANLNMSNYNVTSISCLVFGSGGKICSGS